MEYKTYDELISPVAVRLKHRNLTDDELDRLVKRTFKIDQATKSYSLSLDMAFAGNVCSLRVARVQ